MKVPIDCLARYPRFRAIFSLLLLITSFVATNQLLSSDWPRWRGPHNSGAAGKDEPELMSLPSVSKPLWQRPVGDGFSSPVVAQGRLAFMDNEGGKEVVHVVDALDGKELWKEAIDDVFKDFQGPPGPRNTPVIDGERLYAVSCKGELQCRSMLSGALLWRVNYTNDFGAVFIGEKGTAPAASRHGNNGSPLVDGAHLIAPVGGTNGHSIVAFDKYSGKVAWHSENDFAGYGSPVVADLGGIRHVVAFTADGIIGLRRDKGTLLWRIPVKTAFSRHVVTPVVWNDMVVAGSHQFGLVGIKIKPEGMGVRAEQVWLSKEAAPNVAHAVANGQFMLNLGPKKNLQYVDLVTGKVAWSFDDVILSPADRAYAGIIRIQQQYLVLTDTGELVLFRPGASKAEGVFRLQVCGSTWCNPAYANGIVFLRDGIKGNGKLMAVAVR